MTTRRSSLALIVVKLNVDGADCLMFHRHRKWGDWSLVGGHVEPGEEGDWFATASREANEELAPLSESNDFVVEDLLGRSVEWGPVPSRSAGGQATTYAVRYFVLRFIVEPKRALEKLAPEDFALLPIKALEAKARNLPVSDTFERLSSALPRGLGQIPPSWAKRLSAADLNFSVGLPDAVEERELGRAWPISKRFAAS